VPRRPGTPLSNYRSAAGQEITGRHKNLRARLRIWSDEFGRLGGSVLIEHRRTPDFKINDF
jgi:hypothetical protein